MRTFKKLFLLSITLIAISSEFSSAHEGGHEASESSPIIHQKNGTHISGTFISIDFQQVRILDEKGKVLRVALDSLTDESLKRVELLRLEIQKRNEIFEASLINVPTIPKSQSSTDDRPDIAESFKAFEKDVKIRWDREFLYVESDGIPDHAMMVGIRSWQQQVPLPQDYTGANAWRIPLQPTPAKEPVSANGRFLRGAIALAVNGIPIFNPLNNRGDDAFLFGELDEFGGHCGRADDYHYHIAPINLEKIVGKGKPIAYALDGYPILGFQDPKDPDFAPLDKLNGHKDKKGNYHYHATKDYPYVNGGFYGMVTERDGQVDPQPRAEPVRPALQPMRGAKITKFEQNGKVSVLTYQVSGKEGTVRYSQNENGSLDFVFTEPNGKGTKETYSRRQRGQGGGPGGAQQGGRPPRGNGARPNREGNGPNRDDRENRGRPPAQEDQRSDPTVSNAKSDNTMSRSAITLTSESVGEDGFVSIDCTCDGKKQTPAIAWENLPKDTKSIAISLWHTAPDQEKSYWLVYNIPVDVEKLEQNGKNIGKSGLNDKRKLEYDPMCSKGLGVKTYHITVYAFSKVLDVEPNQMNRKRLLEEALKFGISETTLDFKYERK